MPGKKPLTKEEKRVVDKELPRPPMKRYGKGRPTKTRKVMSY